MAITIKAYDGLDFGAYLKTFDDTFEASSFGYFSDDPSDIDGNNYALTSSSDTSLPVEGGLSFIADSGDEGEIVYDFATHVIGGTLDALKFGEGLTYDEESDSFSTDLDVAISGLGLEGEGSGNPVSGMIGALRGGSTEALRDLLKGEDLVFKGSTGSDAFKGFGGGDDQITGGKGFDTLNGAAGDDQIAGGAGADDLKGGAGADTLAGGKGDDVLAGGKGADLFVFDGVGLGDDTISGFQAGKGQADQIGIGDFFDDFDAVLAATTDQGGNAVIDLGGGASITLTGVVEADLHANDFLFD
jgi:serralysin